MNSTVPFSEYLPPPVGFNFLLIMSLDGLDKVLNVNRVHVINIFLLWLILFF